MKKVMVTGGSGFIGGYVVERLLDGGYEVLVFDRHHHSVEWEKRRGEGVEFFLGDVTDDVAVTEAMAHVDGWIHLAAVLGTQETIKNPRPAAMSNVLGGLNMLEAAAQYDLPGVYICVGNHWMNNTYSISKTTVERFVRMYNNDRGTHVNMVRAVNAYGPRQSVASPFGPAKVRKITPAMVCRALVGQPIEVYGDGRQVSDMVAVQDVAEALVRSLERAADGFVFGTPIEVGPEEHHTVNDVAGIISALAAMTTGVAVPVDHLPMRPGEIPGDRVTANTDTLGFVGMLPHELIPLSEGMAATVEWYAKNEGVTWHR